MRGRPESQRSTPFHNFDPASLIPAGHPLRAIRAQMDAELQALHSIRSERQLCEQISSNLLFRWFVGLDAGVTAWDPRTFTKHRERFSEHGLMQAFFESTVAHGIAATAAKCEDFAVDGTLIRSWASLKSVQSKGDTGAHLGHPMQFLMEQEAGVLTGVSIAEANRTSERFR